MSDQRHAVPADQAQGQAPGLSHAQPRVLIVATGRWISTARLALALHSLGCQVHLLSLRTHPARLTRALHASYRYSPLRPLPGLRRALQQAQPAAVIAADELAVLHLEELLQALPHDPSRQEGGHSADAHDENLRALIQRSIGGPDVLFAARSRMQLLSLAEEEGIATPETVRILSPDDLEPAFRQLGAPLVLKADATSGGQGVRIAATLAEARRAFRALARPPGLLRALKRGFVAKDWTHLRPWARATARGVTAQPFIAGTERTGMAVCLHGQVVSCVCLEVLRSWCVRGPSSVVRVVQDNAMENAMRRVAARLRLSGFCGFDFIVRNASAGDAPGEPLLIEMNPRPTQLVHLPLGPGRDLVAAFVCRLLGRDVPDRPAATEGDLLALFPQELQRDIQSEFLHTAFHDVPWSEPVLIRHALKGLPGALSGLSRDPRWQRDPDRQ